MSVRSVGTRALPTAIAAGALMLGLTACGGSSHSTSSTSSVAATPTTTSGSSPTGTTATTTTTSAHKPRGHKKAKPHKAKTKSTTTPTTTTTTPTTTPTTPAHTTTTPPPSTPTYVKPMKATLVGANHDPIAKKLWRYTVTATDANGKPLSGTADIEFTFHGQVVGHATPPTDPIKNGRWSDLLTFPPDSVGQPLALQVVVHTSLGTATLVWPVMVKKK